MKQNEIWLINLNPTVGAEIRKTRPAMIVNNNALGKLPLKIIVRITDWKGHYKIAPRMYGWNHYRKMDLQNYQQQIAFR